MAALVLALCAYWFAVADRYIVFLYHHDMGPLYPDTSPFSRVTSSRYWMASLVAAGAVMVCYTAANGLLEALVECYRPPAWWRVWAASAPLLMVGIPAITMTANEPTLPAKYAAEVTLAALIGMGLALLPGSLAAQAPSELWWLAADGLGMMLILLTLIQTEKVSRWLAQGQMAWLGMAAAGLVGGVAWLLLTTGLRRWRRRRMPSARALLIAGACMAYLLMPLVHHVVGTDGYFYISDSDNFFAQKGATQAAAWLIAEGFALGLTWWRSRLAARGPRLSTPVSSSNAPGESAGRPRPQSREG